MKNKLLFVLAVSFLIVACKTITPPKTCFCGKGVKSIGGPSAEYKVIKADSSGKFIDQWFNKPNATISFDTVVYYGTSILLSFKDEYTPKNTNIGCSGELLSASLINIKNPKHSIKCIFRSDNP